MAQISILHKDWIHTIVIGLILGALIYLQRGRLAGLHQRTADLVRRENVRAEGLKQGCGRRFAAAQPAGEADAQHA